MSVVVKQSTTEWQEAGLPALPADWQAMTIDEIKAAEKKAMISGPFGSNISSKYFVNEGVPVIRGNNLSLQLGEKFKDDGFVYITIEKADELNTWASKEDLIFTAVGTIGQVGILTGSEKYKRYIISNKQLRLTVNKNMIEPLFAYYWFASEVMVEQIKQRNTGSSVPLINLGVLKSLIIPVPSLKEQKAIVSVLSSLDDKIDLLHRQNKTLEAMAETLFRQWFVEEAGDWEERPLKNVCVIQNGYAFQSQTYKESGQKILRTMNFSNHWIELKGFVYISEELAKSFEKFYIQRNDFLLVMVGASLGSFAIVTKDVLPALQNQNMWCFRANKDVPQHYLNFVLRQLINETLHGASGSAREFFQKGVFYELTIVVPPADLMRRFDAASEAIFSKIELNRYQMQSLENLRDALLPKLMSGEVRVA